MRVIRPASSCSQTAPAPRSTTRGGGSQRVIERKPAYLRPWRTAAQPGEPSSAPR